MMNCQSIVDRFSEYLDERLPDSQRTDLSAHLDDCRECDNRLEEMRRLRSSLRAVPARPVPPQLRMSLRVIASRERARNAGRRTYQGMIDGWSGSFKLWMNNLMRPLAIPFAGGLCSAILLFSMLVPSFTTRYSQAADVPTGLYTGASLKSTMFSFSADEVVLELEIDDQGRMVDYTVTSGQHWMQDPALRRNIENNLLFTRFTPATTFGQPMSGKVRISFRPRSYIDVKG